MYPTDFFSLFGAKLIKHFNVYPPILVCKSHELLYLIRFYYDDYNHHDWVFL